MFDFANILSHLVEIVNQPPAAWSQVKPQTLTQTTQGADGDIGIGAERTGQEVAAFVRQSDKSKLSLVEQFSILPDCLKKTFDFIRIHALIC